MGDRPGSVLGRTSPYMMGSRLGMSQISPTKQRRSPTLYRSTLETNSHFIAIFTQTRTQSCYVGGLGEEKDEVTAEMDDKIRELTEAVSDKDAELEQLREMIRALQEKVASDEKEETVTSSDDKDDITEEAVEG